MTILLKKIYITIRNIYAKIFPFKIIELDPKDESFIYYSTKSYNHLKTDFDDLLIRQNFKDFSTRTEEEYVYCLDEPCFKDPYHGWIITKTNKIIRASIPYSNWKNDWAQHPIPNRFDYHFKKHITIELEEAISCDMIYRFGNNYFHFYNSLIGQLALLHKQGINIYGIPVLVPINIYREKFFNEAIEEFSNLKRVHFIPTDNLNIYRFKRIHFAKTNPYSIANWSNIHDMLNIKNNSTHDIKRIFINRKKNTYRSLTNDKEIIRILEKYNFTVIYPEVLTLQEQIAIFHAAKDIVAIHGAGLTNLIFRFPKSSNLFELFSNKQIVPGYYSLVNEMGGKYYPTIGNNEDKNGRFSIDPILFESKLKKWLNESE